MVGAWTPFVFSYCCISVAMRSIKTRKTGTDHGKNGDRPRFPITLETIYLILALSSIGI
jgi:hypothetical protein